MGFLNMAIAQTNKSPRLLLDINIPPLGLCLLMKVTVILLQLSMYSIIVPKGLKNRNYAPLCQVIYKEAVPDSKNFR